MNQPKISFLSRLVNLMVPPRCPICGGRLAAGEELLCGRCNLRLPRTHYEQRPYINPMAKLFWGKFKVEKCAALFFYNSNAESPRVILDLKYRKHPEYGFRLGLLMVQEMAPNGFFEGIDAVMPLPLAANRERMRGYNQSRELARGICKAAGLPMVDNVVKREKFVESQTHMRGLERMENVRNTFKLIDGASLQGRHILLVDDVVTTGSSMTEFAREVVKAQNTKVSILAAGFAGL